MFLIEPGFYGIALPCRDVIVKTGDRFVDSLLVENVPIFNLENDSPVFRFSDYLAVHKRIDTERIRPFLPCPDKIESLVHLWYRQRTQHHRFLVDSLEPHLCDESWGLPGVFDLPNESGWRRTTTDQSIGLTHYVGSEIDENLVLAYLDSEPSSQTIVTSRYLAAHFNDLGSNEDKGNHAHGNAAKADKKESYVWGIFRTKETLELGLRYSLGPIALYGGAIMLYFAGNKLRRWRMWVACACSIGLIAAGLGAFFLPVYWQDACDKYNDCQTFQHDVKIVPQKPIDTPQ